MSNASVNTAYAGESGPNENNGGRTGVTIALVASALALPIVALSAFGVWGLFSWARIRRSVIFFFLAIYSVIILVLSPFINFFDLFISAWVVNAPKLFASKGEDIVGQVLTIFAQQAPLSIIIGTLIGLTYASWFWKFRRAAWEETRFRLAPWELWRKKKNIEDIKNDRNTPANGLTLGISEETGHKEIQTFEEASAHTFIIGASGSGKTTTMLMQARDVIKDGHGLIFTDLKGTPGMATALKEFADRYNRPFRHWSMQSIHEPYTGPSELGPAYYDPIYRGEASRRKNLLMAIKEWSEPYYEALAEEYLQKAFLVLIGNEKIRNAKGQKTNLSTLEQIAALLDPKVLLKEAEKLIHDPNYRVIVEEIGKMNDEKASRDELSAIGSLRVDMKNLTHNVVGPWLKKDPNQLNDINLKDVAHNGEVVLFSLDSSNYRKEAAVLGNLIIEDLKTVSSELRADPAGHPFHVFLDEFSAIGSDNIIQLVNKSRDANMPVTLTTQALGDLRKVDDAFLDQLLGIINCFIIHRTNTQEDAEVFAGLTGTVIRKKFRQSVEHSKGVMGLGKGSGAGAGFIEDVEEYRVTIPELQELPAGKMVYVAKAQNRIQKITVIPERTDLSKATSNNPKVMFVKPDLKKDSNPALSDSIVDDFVPIYPEPEEFVLAEKKAVKPPEEDIIQLRPADPARLEKIFNRPATEFIEEKKVPYNKHLMPPKVVVPETPTQPQPQNLNPPVFTLPARTNLPQRKPAVSSEQKPVLTKTPIQTQVQTQPTPVEPVEDKKAQTKPQPKILPKKETPKTTVKKVIQTDPNKDKFDF
jgi:hypothetical protein